MTSSFSLPRFDRSILLARPSPESFHRKFPSLWHPTELSSKPPTEAPIRRREKNESSLRLALTPPISNLSYLSIFNKLIRTCHIRKCDWLNPLFFHSSAKKRALFLGCRETTGRPFQPILPPKGDGPYRGRGGGPRKTRRLPSQYLDLRWNSRCCLSLNDKISEEIFRPICPVSWRKWTDDGKIRVIPFFLFKTISTSNKKYWIGRIYLSCVSQLINLLGERLKTTDVCLMFPWDYHKKWQFSYIKAKTEPQSDHNFIALSPWRKLLPHPPHQMMIWKGW